MRVLFHRRFKKQYKKLPGKIQQQVKRRLSLFKSDPLHPQLDNHALRGQFKHHRSIDITGDVRAHYRHNSQDTVTFTQVGTHSQLYG